MSLWVVYITDVGEEIILGSLGRINSCLHINWWRRMHVPGGGGREISSIPCNDPWRKGRLAEVGVQWIFNWIIGVDCPM